MGAEVFRLVSRMENYKYVWSAVNQYKYVQESIHTHCDAEDRRLIGFAIIFFQYYKPAFRSHSNGGMLPFVTCVVVESVKETIHEWNDFMDAWNGVLGNLFHYEQKNLGHVISLIHIKYG